MDADAAVTAKRALRAVMRSLRLGLDEQQARSSRVCDHLAAIDAVRRAHTVMVFDAVAGEPDLAAFATWCAADGKRVVAPEPARTAPDPLAPELLDVVVLPGLAFTPDGRRLGQGGGWYDRYLARMRDDAVAIGVCFEAQLVEDLPTEAHDVQLDLVVTESGVAATRDHP